MEQKLRHTIRCLSSKLNTSDALVRNLRSAHAVQMSGLQAALAAAQIAYTNVVGEQIMLKRSLALYQQCQGEASATIAGLRKELAAERAVNDTCVGMMNRLEEIMRILASDEWHANHSISELNQVQLIVYSGMCLTENAACMHYVRECAMHKRELDEYNCCVCMSARKDIVLVPCRHTMCSACASCIDSCPLCREEVTQMIEFRL